MRVNAYDCPVCGGTTWTRDVDEGVTPMFLKCRTGCGKGTAVSRCYNVPTDHPEPTHEWFLQTRAQARRADRKWPGSLRHWEGGGLSLREIRPTPAHNEGGRG